MSASSPPSGGISSPMQMANSTTTSEPAPPAPSSHCHSPAPVSVPVSTSSSVALMPTSAPSALSHPPISVSSSLQSQVASQPQPLASQLPPQSISLTQSQTHSQVQAQTEAQPPPSYLPHVDDHVHPPPPRYPTHSHLPSANPTMPPPHVAPAPGPPPYALPPPHVSHTPHGLALPPGMPHGMPLAMNPSHHHPYHPHSHSHHQQHPQTVVGTAPPPPSHPHPPSTLHHLHPIAEAPPIDAHSHPHTHPHVAHPMHTIAQHISPLTTNTPGYYEDPMTKIRRLETELEAARVEIERLRARQAESDKERKQDTPKVQSRYWTPNEHKRFLEALQKFGAKDVRAIASYVGTRNATQVRTHAQKYFLRVAREAKAGSALQAARKRSMSESDLARMGRTVASPPGSPSSRDRDAEHDSSLAVTASGGGHSNGNGGSDRVATSTWQSSPSAMIDERRSYYGNDGHGDGENGGMSSVATHTGDVEMSDGLDDNHQNHRLQGTELSNQLHVTTGKGSPFGGRPRCSRVASTGTLSSLAMASSVFSASASRPDTDMEGTTSSSMAADNKSSNLPPREKLPTGAAIPPLPPPHRAATTHVSASKPPVASPNIADTAGINLLSLVASERKLEAESSMSN